jgi:hypothetical protein
LRMLDDARKPLAPELRGKPKPIQLEPWICGCGGMLA